MLHITAAQNTHSYVICSLTFIATSFEKEKIWTKETVFNCMTLIMKKHFNIYLLGTNESIGFAIYSDIALKRDEIMFSFPRNLTSMT
jgi:hypothetical protein